MILIHIILARWCINPKYFKETIRSQKHNYRSILHHKPKPKLVALLFQLVPRETFHVLLVCTLDMSNNQHSVVPPTLLKSINQGTFEYCI
jgi:hypothetical protein